MTKRIKSVPIDQVLKALGDPVRLSVIKQLLDAGEEKACGTFEHSLTKATFSHHIKILVDAGVITRREDGTRKFLSVSPSLEKEYPGLLDIIRSA